MSLLPPLRLYLYVPNLWQGWKSGRGIRTPLRPWGRMMGASEGFMCPRLDFRSLFCRLFHVIHQWSHQGLALSLWEDFNYKYSYLVEEAQDSPSCPPPVLSTSLLSSRWCSTSQVKPVRLHRDSAFRGVQGRSSDLGLDVPFRLPLQHLYSSVISASVLWCALFYLILAFQDFLNKCISPCWTDFLFLFRFSDDILEQKQLKWEGFYFGSLFEGTEHAGRKS